MTNLRATLKAVTSARFYNRSICALRSFSAVCSLTDDDIDGVIDAFGQDLHTLHISLGDIGHQTLERLFRECSALCTLHLNHCANLTDELVLVLTDRCQHVAFLSLADAIGITDMSMCYLLHGSAVEEVVS